MIASGETWENLMGKIWEPTDSLAHPQYGGKTSRSMGKLSFIVDFPMKNGDFP
jgi:hypothetical protein